VDVRGPLVYRLRDKKVHHPDDGGRLALLPQVLGVPLVGLPVVLHDLHQPLLGDILDDCAQGRPQVVVLVDRPENPRTGGDGGLDGVAGSEPDVLECLEAQGVGHGDVEVPVLDRDRDDQVLPCDLLGDQLDRLGLDGRVGKVDQRDPELQGEGLSDLVLGGQSQGDDDIAQFFAPRTLFGKGAGQALLGQKPGLHEQFADTLPCGRQ